MREENIICLTICKILNDIRIPPTLTYCHSKLNKTVRVKLYWELWHVMYYSIHIINYMTNWVNWKKKRLRNLHWWATLWNCGICFFIFIQMSYNVPNTTTHVIICYFKRKHHSTNLKVWQFTDNTILQVPSCNPLLAFIDTHHILKLRDNNFTRKHFMIGTQSRPYRIAPHQTLYFQALAFWLANLYCSNSKLPCFKFSCPIW